MFQSPDLRVLELYSGIGGMQYALHAAGIPHSVIAAVDINTVANLVYKHNFPKNNLLQRNIQSLSSKEILKLQPDILTMSPPCQPFTRIGLKKDCKDPRTESFLRVLELLKDIKPKYVLLENVSGFEVSEAHQKLINVLNETDYNFREFLLTPGQFNIPNSRLRYYILAKRGEFCFKPLENTIFKDIPSCSNCKTVQKSLTSTKNLESYLENVSDNYLLSDKILQRFALILDIVDKDSQNCCCFTKGYSHYIEGTGSVLHQNTLFKVSEVYENVSKVTDDATGFKKLNLLKQLELRFFTPREIANIMGFPITYSPNSLVNPTFSFPVDITDRQRYRLLGNSVNVNVIGHLLKVLLCSKTEEPRKTKI